MFFEEKCVENREDKCVEMFHLELPSNCVDFYKIPKKALHFSFMLSRLLGILVSPAPQIWETVVEN